jgi:hypothetical protein
MFMGNPCDDGPDRVQIVDMFSGRVNGMGQRFLLNPPPLIRLVKQIVQFGMTSEKQLIKPFPNGFTVLLKDRCRRFDDLNRSAVHRNTSSV